MAQRHDHLVIESVGTDSKKDVTYAQPSEYLAMQEQLIEAQRVRDKADGDREAARVQASLRLEALQRLQKQSEEDATVAPGQHQRAMELAQSDLADAQREAWNRIPSLLKHEPKT